MIDAPEQFTTSTLEEEGSEGQSFRDEVIDDGQGTETPHPIFHTPLDVERVVAATSDAPLPAEQPSKEEHDLVKFGREHGYLDEAGKPPEEGQKNAVDKMLSQLGVTSEDLDKLAMGDLDLPKLSVGGLIRAIFGNIANFFKNLFRKKPKEESV